MPYKDYAQASAAWKRYYHEVKKKRPDFKERQYKEKLLHRYGLKPEDVEEMKLNQDNKCIGCLEEKPLCIDHDHTTGKVRGLLCRQCNACIGLSGENLDVLKNLVTYLEQTNSEKLP